MFRNKLSFILASSLCLSIVGCDDEEGGDTGAGATESGSTTDDSGTSDTPTSGTPTTGTPMTTTTGPDGTSTTDDSSDESSTTDDTTADPCADVTCEDGEVCVAGICVEDDGETDGETDGGGDGDPTYPNPAGGCPAGTVDGSMALMDGPNVCLAACQHKGATNIVDACPQPATGTATAVCVLGGGGSEDACETPQAACETEGEYCLSSGVAGDESCFAADACLINCGGGATCPDGMSCNAASLCGYDE